MAIKEEYTEGYRERLFQNQIKKAQQERIENLENEIKNRIQAEYTKHKNKDWALIAAKKIVAAYLE